MVLMVGLASLICYLHSPPEAITECDECSMHYTIRDFCNQDGSCKWSYTGWEGCCGGVGTGQGICNLSDEEHLRYFELHYLTGNCSDDYDEQECDKEVGPYGGECFNVPGYGPYKMYWTCYLDLSKPPVFITQLPHTCSEDE